MANVTIHMAETLFEQRYLPAIRHRVYEQVATTLRQELEKLVTQLMAEVSIDVMAQPYLQGLSLEVNFNWKKA